MLQHRQEDKQNISDSCGSSESPRTSSVLSSPQALTEAFSLPPLPLHPFLYRRRTFWRSIWVCIKWYPQIPLLHPGFSLQSCHESCFGDILGDNVQPIFLSPCFLHSCVSESIAHLGHELWKMLQRQRTVSLKKKKLLEYSWCMATHSSILPWKSPWTEEPGGLQSTGSKRVGHNWATKHTRSWFIGLPSKFVKIFPWDVTEKPDELFGHPCTMLY